MDIKKPNVDPEQLAKVQGWSQAVMRNHLVSNAGGALATLSFVGATWHDGVFLKAPLVPLTCFVVGLILAGFSIQGEHVDAVRRLTKGRADMNLPSWFMPVLLKGGLYGAVASVAAHMCFVVGAISGLILLWIA